MASDPPVKSRRYTNRHVLDAPVDTLDGTDRSAYFGGLWLRPAKVTSAELRGHHDTDPDGIAELAARCEVMGE